MTSTATAVPTGSYAVDPAHSNVAFEVRHMGIATVRGAFKQFEGAVESDADGLHLRGTVAIESVDTGTEDRDAHLRSPEFFDAQQFPQIAFTSDEPQPGTNGEIELTGEITIRGVTKPIELAGELNETTEDPWGNQRIGFEVEGRLDRREFGLDWNQVLPNGNLLVANEVKLIVNVSAVKGS